jgi:hypothetical protein
MKQLPAPCLAACLALVATVAGLPGIVSAQAPAPQALRPGEQTETIRYIAPPEPTEEEPAVLPAAIVDRFTTAGDRVTRVSLFSDRVAVVSVREGDTVVLYRQMRISPEELAGYVGSLQLDASSVRTTVQAEGLAPAASRGVILLYPGSGPPRRIEYQAMTTVDLATSRLIAVLDELEARVSAVGPYYHELQSWVPQEGDRVALVNGNTAVVDRVHESGTVELLYNEVSIRELVPPDQLLKVVLRKLPVEP